MLMLFGVLAFACSRENIGDGENLLQVPRHFPSVPFPSDNAFSDARYELGKKLFFDSALSLDSSISCSSCHKAKFGLADEFAVSPGVEGRLGTRNAPGLFNLAYAPHYLREGGVPTLEMQVLVPIQEHAEMDFNMVDLAARLAQNPIYVEMSKKAYYREMSPFVITRALATYERTMLSGESAFDYYTYLNVPSALTPSQIRGMQLFNSDRTHCSSCHSGLLFSNFEFENNGLYVNYADLGRMRLTGDTADEALFSVPMLRNVEYTAPYMHDGSIATLDEVIEHYNSGGAGHRHQSKFVQPLHLTEAEKADLLAFLLSLSDPNVLVDVRFRE